MLTKIEQNLVSSLFRGDLGRAQPQVVLCPLAEGQEPAIVQSLEDVRIGLVEGIGRSNAKIDQFKIHFVCAL